MRPMLLSLSLGVVCFSIPSLADEPFISGLNPDRRPPFATLKTPPQHPTQADVHGIEGDIPDSVKKALRSQGGWYTPLTEPGMTGPYDIRGYHSAEDAKKAEAYLQKQWDPIHFKPQIDRATNEQCLSCHQEIFKQKVLDQSQAGVKPDQVLAWYQTLETYTGKQENLHWRHFQSEFAKRVTQLQCTTCHQGSDPRETAWVPPSTGKAPDFTLRRSYNPRTCLMCHGQFPEPKVMGLPGHWAKFRDAFQNNCLLCHQAVRSNRHQVNFLNPAGIEAAGKESGDSCFGCHGGRAWYRISFPYPRHPWPGMPAQIPEWAKKRPTESEPRFLIQSEEKAGK